MSATTISQLAGYKGWSLSASMRPVQLALRTPWRSFRRRLVQKPGSTLAITAATAFACTIMTNALALQTERHPSPMFTSLTGPVAKVDAAEAPIPVPPIRPSLERQKPEATVAAVRDSKPRIKEEPQRTASISANPKDQMLAIIADSAGDKASGAAPASEPSPARIASIQKALNKAGFGPVKEDGAFGAGTRRALERFEAERKLTVRGEPNGKVLKELARVTGVAIN